MDLRVAFTRETKNIQRFFADIDKPTVVVNAGGGSWFHPLESIVGETKRVDSEHPCFSVQKQDVRFFVAPIDTEQMAKLCAAKVVGFGSNVEPKWTARGISDHLDGLDGRQPGKRLVMFYQQAGNGYGPDKPFAVFKDVSVLEHLMNG